jgi:hypothetical protein
MGLLGHDDYAFGHCQDGCAFGLEKGSTFSKLATMVLPSGTVRPLALNGTKSSNWLWARW